MSIVFLREPCSGWPAYGRVRRRRNRSGNSGWNRRFSNCSRVRYRVNQFSSSTLTLKSNSIAKLLSLSGSACLLLLDAHWCRITRPSESWMWYHSGPSVRLLEPISNKMVHLIEIFTPKERCRGTVSASLQLCREGQGITNWGEIVNSRSDGEMQVVECGVIL